MHAHVEVRLLPYILRVHVLCAFMRVNAHVHEPQRLYTRQRIHMHKVAYACECIYDIMCFARSCMRTCIGMMRMYLRDHVLLCTIMHAHAHAHVHVHAPIRMYTRRQLHMNKHVGVRVHAHVSTISCSLRVPACTRASACANTVVYASKQT